MKEPKIQIKTKYALLALPVSLMLTLNARAAETIQEDSLSDLIIYPYTVMIEESQEEGRDTDGGLTEYIVVEECESPEEAESESESESESEISETEERNFRLRHFLSSMPEGFLFPMVTEPRSEKEPMKLYDLADTRQLPGYRPVFLHGEKVLFGPGRDFLVEYRELSVLQPQLEKMIAGYDGDWSVYVKNLNTEESFVINDRPMKSASVMKLFIMGTVYRAFESGELERTEEIMSLMENMISVSDNECSNQLLYLLGDSSYQRGIEKVNGFIREYGFSDMTVEYNGFENAETVMDSSHFNQVSAKDCGKLLEDVYRRVWVNRAGSNEIEQMMLNQYTRYKIPAGLPEGVLCGNKSGEMDTTENDAAIIYSGNCDYILVILSSDWYSKDEAISRIASLSRTVYEFLN